MTLWHKIVLFVSWVSGIKMGTATNFSAQNDPGNPEPYAACLHRDLRDADLIVAHKTLPCLSKVLIYNIRNGKCVVAKVGDRGPVHASLDLNVAVTKALKANGMETVLFIPGGIK